MPDLPDHGKLIERHRLSSHFLKEIADEK
jgi:hypothetical protein